MDDYNMGIIFSEVQKNNKVASFTKTNERQTQGETEIAS